MEIATLFHNPGAGGEDHSKKELVALIEKSGYKCRYSSTAEKGWKDDEIDPDSDFIIVAGGDGTIRKVTELLLKRSVLDKRYPIGLIPLGTANNIAKTLDLKGEPEDIVAGWNPESICRFDATKHVVPCSRYVRWKLCPVLCKRLFNRSTARFGKYYTEQSCYGHWKPVVVSMRAIQRRNRRAAYLERCQDAGAAGGKYV